MWQAEADTELTLSASPTTAVGQKALALAKRRYSTVVFLKPIFFTLRLNWKHNRIELVTRSIYQGSLCHILLQEDNPNTTKVDFGYCEDTYHTCQKAVFLNPYRAYQACSHCTSKFRCFCWVWGLTL